MKFYNQDISKVITVRVYYLLFYKFFVSSSYCTLQISGLKLVTIIFRKLL